MAKKAKSGKSSRDARVHSGTKGASASPWRWAAAAAVIVTVGVAALLFLAHDRDRLQARANLEAARWSASYWQRPIAPQGIPPAEYIDAAKSLQPEDCGTCHPAQFAGWTDSLHGAAMGPGVMGQFPTLHPDEVTECHACHAPLSEQYARLPGAQGAVPNGLHDPALMSKGLVCAACHVREHRRHGPPLREGRAGLSQAVHGDPVRTPYFESAEFCKGCHQHPDSAQKVGGKPVENTYNEWLASPQATQGITCQGCHMPDRQHLWKGIHDPEMTASGVTIEAQSEPEPPRAGGSLRATLRVTNTGTGHAFPTYTTPAVYLRAALLGADDRPLRGHYEEVVLQRRLDMSTDPWSEEFDTRLLPGKSATLEFTRTIPEDAVALYLWLWVDPDQFYNGFFRQRLSGDDAFQGRAQLRAALEEAERRQYLLWSKRIAIQP